MITTSATKLEYKTEDGGLLDSNPWRRTARLRDGGVRIQRVSRLRHVVHLPDGRRRRCRTYGTAERIAHTYLYRGGRA
jgi:hypothetical protein